MYSSIYEQYPDVLTVKELQTMLGNISKKTLYRWIHDNKIPCFKLGRVYYIPTLELFEQITPKTKKEYKKTKIRIQSEYHPRKRR